MHHVAFFHNVFLAFEAPTASILGSLFTVPGNEVFECHYFGTNKSLLKISMNFARGFRCGITNTNCPGPDFLNTGGEISLQL